MYKMCGTETAGKNNSKQPHGMEIMVKYYLQCQYASGNDLSWNIIQFSLESNVRIE